MLAAFHCQLHPFLLCVPNLATCVSIESEEGFQGLATKVILYYGVSE